MVTFSSILFYLFFNWRIITLHNFVVFCQISTRISHKYTYVPSLLYLLPHTTPLGYYRAPVCHSSILPGKFHGHRSLVDSSPWGHKESDRTYWLNNNNHTDTLQTGLNVPCSGCRGPPGPLAQAPGRTGQSGAVTQTGLGSHPRPRREIQVGRRSPYERI